MRILDGNRNMTAPRRDSNLRTLIEHFHVLKHYRRLPRAELGRVFAREIATAKLDANSAPGPLLAELALLGQHPAHRLFALDTMFEGMPESGDYPRLIELAGALDVFAIETVRAEPRLLEQLGEARAQTAQLRAVVGQLEAAQAEAVRVQQALARAHEGAAEVAAARQHLADRLHAALNATYSAAMRVSDQLDVANADKVRMTAALQAIAGHIEAITTRSRVYRLTRLFKGLRRRIEMIAAEAARALGGR
jgi:hypothetical protein